MARKGAFVIISDSNKIMLIKRRDFPVWDLPGGRIEKGETEEQAAIRETEEETGYSIEIQYKIGIFFSNFYKYHSVLVCYFLCYLL